MKVAKSLRVWSLRLAGFFRRDQWEKDLDTELKSNLERHIADNIRASMSPRDARRVARLDPVAALREE